MSGRRWFANPYVILVALVSLVAVGMAGLSLLLLPSPAESVLAAQRKFAKLRSFGVQSEVQWRGTVKWRDASGAARDRDERVRFSADAFMDRAEPAVPRVRQQFTLRAGTQPELPFGGEHVRVGRADLLRFTQLPERIGALRPAPFRDRWVSVDLRGLAAPYALPFIGAGLELGAEDVTALTERFGRTPFFTVLDSLGKERVGGVSVRGYRVRVEPLYLKDFYREHEELRLGRELSAAERASADVFFANLSSEDGEVWVGRDYLPRRLRLRLRFDDGRRTGILDVSADFSRFNEQSAVQPPADAPQDVTDVLATLLPSVAGRLPLAKDGAARVGKPVGADGLGGIIGAPVGDADADGDGLADVMESFYGTDPNVRDSDGDGVTDGAEVANGDNPAGAGKLFDFSGGRF